MAAGYRDRVVTELAQNAADAARRADVPGRLSVWVDDDELHVANIGAPLDPAGLEALAALRASDKPAGRKSVGRYGVGFTAVRAVASAVEVRSITGSVRFDAERTRTEVVGAGLAEPDVGVPMLRLPWSVDHAPAAGWDTEVVMFGVESADDVLAAAASEAVDLLLELDALVSITVVRNGVESVIDRSEAAGPGAVTEVTVDGRIFWRMDTVHARWFLPVIDGVPQPVRRDVLRAPTRSDEALTVPLLVVADVQMQPDRRRVLPPVDDRLRRVAEGYAQVAPALPARYRTAVVPVPGFAASEVDDALRQSISTELAEAPWVPGADGRDLRPADAVLVESASPQLCDALKDVVPGLVAAEVSGVADARALTAAGVRGLGLAAVVEALAGLERDPAWWRRVYDGLEPLVHDGVAAQECASMPVPLTDGRTVTGPRTVLAVEDGSDIGRVGWARVVHPDAVHPLLLRLGTQPARPADLLSDPVLAAMLDDPDTVSESLVEDVLVLARSLGPGAAAVPGLGALPLRSADGEERAADELVLPDSPLARVLYADSPFGIVDPSLVERYGVDALRAVGVGWTFTVFTEDLPTGPDHDLDDEDAWWESLREDPAQIVAIRDLDLVDDAFWPQALTMIAEDPALLAATVDRDGYSAWWLRRHARIGGVRPGLLRAAGDRTFEGVLDPIDHPRAAALTAVLAGTVVDDAAQAEEILDRLADDARVVTGGAAVRTHRALTEAVAAGRWHAEDLDPPPSVRTISGSVCDPADALVLDHPMWAAVVDPNVAVLGRVEGAEALADLLDVDVVSAVVSAEVTEAGVPESIDSDPLLVVLASVLPLPDTVVVHERLAVRLSGAITGVRNVPFWVDSADDVHVQRPRTE